MGGGGGAGRSPRTRGYLFFAAQLVHMAAWLLLSPKHHGQQWCWQYWDPFCGETGAGLCLMGGGGGRGGGVWDPKVREPKMAQQGFPSSQ